ncbi:MAG TPA: succinylglutamate desuccinylase/aspartoacylase family protein [Candidatus Baltobacteraceae bacterium]
MQNYADLQARWKALRAEREIAVREVACIGAPRTLLCADFGELHAPVIAIAAGVHGDEPAGPRAALALAEDGELDRRFAYRMWPCTNPSGYASGTRENADGADVNRSFGRGGQTPEARAIVTANRDRKFMLSLDLHEDCDAGGFYCYEYGEGDLGVQVVEAVAAAGYPIENVLRPDTALEADEIGGLSYTLSVVRHATRRALTFETPLRLPMDDRVAIHRIAVKAAIAALSKLPSYG